MAREGGEAVPVPAYLSQFFNYSVQDWQNIRAIMRNYFRCFDSQLDYSYSVIKTSLLRPDDPVSSFNLSRIGDSFFVEDIRIIPLIVFDVKPISEIGSGSIKGFDGFDSNFRPVRLSTLFDVQTSGASFILSNKNCFFPRCIQADSCFLEMGCYIVRQI